MSSKTRLSVGLALILAVLAGCGDGSDEPSAKTSRQLRESVSEYEAYLQKNAEKLRHWAGTIVLKVKEGSVPKAQSRFAAAQVPRGHLDPAAQQLDGAIDEGFLRIEKALFEEETAGAVVVAKRLLANVEALQRQLDKASTRPERIAEGASRALTETVDADLTGEAEPYSESELTVVAAKLEGADAAIAAVKPLLREKDPELLAEIEASFKGSYAEIGEYGILARDPEQQRPQEPGIAFINFRELDQGEIEALARPLEVLAEQLIEAENRLDG